MSVIYCHINMFQMEQTVILKANDDTDYKILGRAPIEHIDHLIATLCDEYGVKEVRLGGVKQYTVKMKERIETEFLARYKRKINVEIV